MSQPIERALAGAIAGCAATLPMTVAMELLHRRLPASQREPLPPRQITMEALSPTGLVDELAEPQRLGLTLASHFAYGSAMGAIYSVLREKLPVAAPARGVAFGLGVWAGSYLGLLPATGLFPSASRQPAERNALMIAAHVVWGASLDLVLNRLKAGRKEEALRPPVAPALRHQSDGELERKGDGEHQWLADSAPL